MQSMGLPEQCFVMAPGIASNTASSRSMTRHCTTADDFGVTVPTDSLFIAHTYLSEILYIQTAYRAVYSHISRERLTAIGPRLIARGEDHSPSWENPATMKKTAEKALIPLPPTGLVSVTFAKAGRAANQG